MATTDQNIARISTENQPKSQAARQLTGTSFLTLEHIAYFALVVMTPGILLMGIAAALELWASKDDTVTPLLNISNIAVSPGINTTGALSVVAILVVVIPLMYCLWHRVSAEYTKRPGYSGRVAYKLPVYTALGVLAAATIGMFTVMLYVFLSSLALIGVSGADIGQMYLSQFVPALLGLVVYGMTAWYVMWFAKGRDASRVFVRTASLVGALLVIALFVTALTVNHDTKSRGKGNGPVQVLPYPVQNNRTYDF